MYIQELKRDLSGRMLEIWLGTSGLPKEKEEEYKKLWLEQANNNDIKATPSNVSRLPAKSCNCNKA